MQLGNGSTSSGMMVLQSNDWDDQSNERYDLEMHFLNDTCETD